MAIQNLCCWARNWNLELCSRLPHKGNKQEAILKWCNGLLRHCVTDTSNETKSTKCPGQRAEHFGHHSGFGIDLKEAE